MKFSKVLYIVIIVVLLCCSSCTYNQNEKEADINQQIATLQKENEEYKSHMKRAQQRLQDYQKEVEGLKAENTELFEETEIKSKNYELLLSGLEEELQSLKKEIIKDEVKKIFFKDTPLSIDGTTMALNEDSYYIKYESQVYLSAEFLSELYNDDHYGVVVRGIPYEHYLIKSDGYVSMHALAGSTGIFDEFKEQFNNGIYDGVSGSLEGIEFEVGEVGLIRYTLTKPLYTTERGITIGSTKEEVMKAYGTLGDMKAKEWYTFRGNVEYSEGCKFKFSFDENDMVIEISYGWV